MQDNLYILPFPAFWEGLYQRRGGLWIGEKLGSGTHSCMSGSRLVSHLAM
jgi:hypothetical protein